MATGWEVERQPGPDETYDVRHNGKAKLYDAYLSEVERLIRKTDGKGAHYMLIDADGYRVRAHV